MLETLKAAHAKDPALRGLSGYASVLFYPGVQAIWMHKLTSLLRRMGVPVLPVALSLIARAFTGVEIHPGAKIGRRFFIDHGTGVVIGETAEIGDDVMLYHGVTLGGRGFWQDEKGTKRHPTLGNKVVVGVGATILGPVTIGEGSVVGARAVILRNVPAKKMIPAGAVWRGETPEVQYATWLQESGMPLSHAPSTQH